MLLKPGELIHGLDGRRLRVVDLVPVDEEESPYVGLLMVEPDTKGATAGDG